MPLVLIGALLGGGSIFLIDNTAQKLVNLALIGGAGFLVFKVLTRDK